MFIASRDGNGDPIPDSPRGIHPLGNGDGTNLVPTGNETGEIASPSGMAGAGMVGCPPSPFPRSPACIASVHTKSCSGPRKKPKTSCCYCYLIYKHRGNPSHLSPIPSSLTSSMTPPPVTVSQLAHPLSQTEVRASGGGFPSGAKRRWPSCAGSKIFQNEIQWPCCAGSKSF
jgi:hypothetical protein